MTREDVTSAEGLFKRVFEQAADSAAQLLDVANKINDDAIDVRKVLRSAEEGSSHENTKAAIAAISDHYTHMLTELCECGGQIKALVASAAAEDYALRLERARPKSPDGISREALNSMIVAARELKAKMMRRHSDWAVMLINFVNLVRGIDGAQAALLKRPSRLERIMGLAKPAAGEVAGSIVPGFGFLSELAKAQEPLVDQLIDRISQATGTFDQLHAFDDLLICQLNLSRFTLDRISEAEVAETAFLQKFNEAFGPAPLQ